MGFLSPNLAAFPQAGFLGGFFVSWVVFFLCKAGDKESGVRAIVRESSWEKQKKGRRIRQRKEQRARMGRQVKSSLHLTTAGAGDKLRCKVVVTFRFWEGYAIGCGLPQDGGMCNYKDQAAPIR